MPRSSASSLERPPRRCPLRVDVHDGLVGVRDDLRPAALGEDLDPVEEVGLAPFARSVSNPHHGPLERPRAPTWRCTTVDRGKLVDELGERLRHRGEQLQQVGDARDRVVGGQEARKDEAAADRPGEERALLRSRERERRRARPRVRRPRARSRRRGARRGSSSLSERPASPRRRSALRSDTSRSSSCSSGTTGRLVDEGDPLAGVVDDDAEVGADRRDEPFDVRRATPPSAVSEADRSAGEVRGPRSLDLERAEDERQDERGRRVGSSRRRCGTPFLIASTSSVREQVGHVALGRARGVARGRRGPAYEARRNSWRE